MKLILKGDEVDNYLRVVALIRRISRIKFEDKADGEEVIDFIEEIMEEEIHPEDEEEDDSKGS